MDRRQASGGADIAALPRSRRRGLFGRRAAGARFDTSPLVAKIDRRQSSQSLRRAFGGFSAAFLPGRDRSVQRRRVGYDTLTPSRFCLDTPRTGPHAGGRAFAQRALWNQHADPQRPGGPDAKNSRAARYAHRRTARIWSSSISRRPPPLGVHRRRAAHSLAPLCAETAVLVAPPCCVTRGRHRTLTASRVNASSVALLLHT